MMSNPISGPTAERDEYRSFTLSNASGMTVTISERGAALCSWLAPDRYGRMADVLLAAPDGPAPDACAPGSWQGRHAAAGVSLLGMAAGGAAALQVDYQLNDDGSLVIEHSATATVTTPLQPRPHPCFSLNGNNAGSGDHMLLLDADYFVEVDADGAPVGVAAVGGTPFDFRQPAPIGPRLHWPDSQLRLSGGFDHCFFVRNHLAGGQGALREVARVFDPGSGRRLQMYTTEAALQFWSADASADTPGRHWRRGGFCLGANACPSLKSAAWPHVILHPGQVYRQRTVYRLSLQD